MQGVLPKNHRDEVYCYETRNTNWSDYYLLPGTGKTMPPLDHRPRWKGVSGKPNQAHSSLIETPGKYTLDDSIHHYKQFTCFKHTVDDESSLRNLDVPLTNQAYGRRAISELGFPSHSGYIIPRNYREKTPMPVPTTIHAGIDEDCTYKRRFDQEFSMNSANFNNSTRITTQNMRLPHIKISTRPAIQKGRPGYTSTKI